MKIGIIGVAILIVGSIWGYLEDKKAEDEIYRMAKGVKRSKK